MPSKDEMIEQLKQQLAAMTTERDAARQEVDYLKHSPQAAEVDDLTAQLAAMAQERETYFATSCRLEEQLAVSEQQVKAVEQEIAALNAKYWEDHKYTDIRKIDELHAKVKALEEWFPKLVPGGEMAVFNPEHVEAYKTWKQQQDGDA